MSRPGALIGTHHPKAQPASEDACGRPVCEGFGQVGLGFGERPRAPPSRGTAIEHRVARVATEHSGRLGNARESAVFLGNVLQYVFAAERRPPDARKAQFQWLCKMEAGSGIEPLYEDLQSSSAPVHDDLTERRRARVDEGAQALSLSERTDSPDHVSRRALRLLRI